MAHGLCGRCYQRQYMRARRATPEGLDESRRRSLAYQQRLRIENPEKGRQASRIYRARHPERVRMAWLRWEQAHPERARQVERESVRRYAQRFPEKVRRLRVLGKQRWRSRLLAAFIEDVDPDVLIVRDQGVCWICLGTVAPTEVSVDHVLPLSLGGEHSYANVRLAHTLCNVRRGTRPPALTD